MFRIILELNDFYLLRKMKARLMGEVSEGFSSLYPGLSVFRVEGPALVLEAGDIAADYLVEGLYRFYQELLKKRLLLHGFFIGVDYSPSKEFSIHPDGKWSVLSSRLDSLYLTESANEVLIPFICTEGSGPLLRVTGISDVSAEKTQPFHGFAEGENLALIHEIFQFWKDSRRKGRPFFIHSLNPAEQYRLAVSVADEAGEAENLPLIDLNYPWRSPCGAFLGAFGAGQDLSLAPEVPEESREEWRRLGEGLIRGEDLFCEQDALSWLSRTFPAYAGGARKRGVVPVVLLTGAERMNRVARRIVEGILAPLHERGILFCLLLGAHPPRYKRSSCNFTEFRRAPHKGRQTDLYRLYSELKDDEKKTISAAALFAPFLPAADLLSCLYRTGSPRQKIDTLFAKLVASGGAFRTWRYFFPLLKLPYRLSREDFQRRGINELLSFSGGMNPAPFGLEYAAIAAMLSPDNAVSLFVPLLRVVYGFGGDKSLPVLFSVFGLLKGRYRRLFRIAGFLMGRETAYVEPEDTAGAEDEYEGEIDSLVDIVSVGNMLFRGDHSSALSRAKNVLFRVQEKQSPCHVARAQLSVGSSMLCMGRVEEANDYFSLAYETSKSCSNTADRMESCIRRGISLFLFGNYSRADRQLSDGIRIAGGYCRGDSLLFAHFLKGRIAFTLGRYAAAEELFWKCLSIAMVLGEPHQLFYAWLGRSMIYSGRLREGTEILAQLPRTAEVLYYRAEGKLFEGDIPCALDLARRSERTIRIETPPVGCFGRYTWQNGYSNIEDCAFHGPDGRRVLLNCVSALRWYLESLGGNPQAGRMVLEKITREEKLGELDPYYHFYYLVHALLIPEDTHNESLERITYVSKGLKYLQRIGSVIDDVSSRLDFINKSHWNRMLMDIARNEKLA